IALNGLEDHVSVINDDLANLPQFDLRSKVDLMLCNPPYFNVDKESNLNESEHYLLSRHVIATHLESICHVAQQVLKANGR
ncbi:SAM-dependent methyltransferase, partial [Streptococcus suis]